MSEAGPTLVRVLVADDQDIVRDGLVTVLSLIEGIEVVGGVDGVAKPFVARVDGRRPPMRGDTLRVRPTPEHLHVFHDDSGERLN